MARRNDPRPGRGATRTAPPASISTRKRPRDTPAGELGLRHGEVAQVHANDVVDDLFGWSLRVHGKGGRIRVLPMPDDLARDVQRACRTGGGYAFPGRINGHLSAPRVGRIVSGFLPEGVSMHALRHRFATLAHGVDHDLLVVQALLGHASVETTRR